jgi:hypothetical protein
MAAHYVQTATRESIKILQETQRVSPVKLVDMLVRVDESSAWHVYLALWPLGQAVRVAQLVCLVRISPHQDQVWNACCAHVEDSLPFLGA